MALPTIRIESIGFSGDGGTVWYEIEYPDGITSYMVQPFSRTGAPTPTRKLVWKWDGNTIAPTLTPSFRCRDGRVTVHLFLTKGKIVLCGDSTVRVADVV